MYWSKNDARDKYDSIRTETIDFFISQTIQTATEFDLASVLFNMYKDRFVCTSIKNKTWYEYINHRWHEIDSGNTLRLSISKEMHEIYFDKTCETTNKAHSLGDPGDPNREKLMKVSQKITDICTMLKKTQSKQNIMREACELFYDKDFISKLDRNPYLLCFNNGVVDFKQKIHRKGQPDDFISKCTNIDYIPYNPLKYSIIVNELNEFMQQLFPVKELETYMWEHLSSCLIGINTNQTFHVYKGSGRNGKSALTSLMSKSMGTYKGTVPITLITAKRNSIGATSSEVAQLDGVRYAVMQEPTKGDKINEGAMKELTGGTDPIQARALFKDTITFIPQFKLVVCTNTDFENTSNDDGTWRRMRYIDFMSKFLEKPYEDEIKFPRSECPYQYPLDKTLEERFDDWAPIFMSILVNKTYQTLGLVKDCNSVMANSDKHREGQDFFAGFAKDKLKKKEGDCVKKTELYEEFKKWYIQNYGKDIPKGKELNEFMDKRFGIYTKGGWRNIAINYDDDGDEMDNI
jgi:P4 family phage/plasmid primase-like protien